MTSHDETLLQTDLLPSIDDNAEQVIFKPVNQAALAWADIRDGLKKWPIWTMLAYQDIKLRYRRSVLGPFWLTISMAITVYSMGLLYARLFHVELAHYFPYLVSGMLAWTMISTIVMEFTEGFAGSDAFIKQINLPYTLHIHRTISRNMIIFFHNLFVIIPVLIIFHETAPVNFKTLLLIPGLFVLYFNALTYGITLAIIGARYRDIAQIIKSLIQVVFFITPVMWSPETLITHYHWVVDLNPFYAFLEMIRAPLQGQYPGITSLIMVTCLTLVGIVSSFMMLTRYRSRIVYWL